MYCNKCGKEIDDEALICPYCGCGTVNYIRDQAKALDCAAALYLPRRLWCTSVLCRQDLDGASLALYARLLGHWHAG